MNNENSNFSTYFATLPDPRRDNGRLQHQLLDIMAIALCAVLSGAESFVAMEEFGYAKRAWLQERLGLALTHGIPSHDTFQRLFARLDPQAFERCFREWTQELKTLTRGQVIAVDGKTLRHSFDTATGKSALHMVSAWAQDNRLILGQTAVEDKTNEITAVPQLLEMLDIKDCIVTVDALNTQKALAEQMIAQQADYVFALKGNHGRLHDEVADFFDWLEHKGKPALQKECQSITWSQNFGHGRCEVRRAWSLDATNGDWTQAVQQWPGLRSIVMVETERSISLSEPDVATTWSTPQYERRYYLSSLPPNAQALLRAVREHWGIENSVHWVLDVTFEEDASRIRKDHAAQNMSILRRLSLNLLRQDSQHKRGLKTRRHRVAWDNDYLLRILVGS